MDISKLTEPEKSVMLAQAIGWEFSRQECGEGRWSWIDESGNQISGSLHDSVVKASANPNSLIAPMLYSSARMALARRVLNWAYHNIIFDWDYWLIATYEPGEEGEQAGWLDKVLELAIEAGLAEPLPALPDD